MILLSFDFIIKEKIYIYIVHFDYIICQTNIYLFDWSTHTDRLGHTPIYDSRQKGIISSKKHLIFFIRFSTHLWGDGTKRMILGIESHIISLSMMVELHLLLWDFFWFKNDKKQSCLFSPRSNKEAQPFRAVRNY